MANLQDVLSFGLKRSIELSSRSIYDRRCATLTFEPVTLKYHQCHVDLLVITCGSCGQFH